MNETVSLVYFDKARVALEKAATVDEVKSIRDKAEALRVYSKQSGQSLEMQNRCAEIKLRAERRAGELLGEMEPKAGRPEKSLHDERISKPKLSDLGITEIQSHRWQSIAKIKPEVFEKHIAEVKNRSDEITTAGLLRAGLGAHVGRNAGENEWYTSGKIIEIARAVLGEIDLDPASHPEAQKVIKAKAYYTAKENGLNGPWKGRIWLNPPYAQPLIQQFCEKLVAEIHAGNTAAAITLTNNATETAWGQLLLRESRAICFPAGRKAFWSPARESVPLQGQMLCYFGKQPEIFFRNVAHQGVCFYGTPEL